MCNVLTVVDQRSTEYYFLHHFFFQIKSVRYTTTMYSAELKPSLNTIFLSLAGSHIFIPCFETESMNVTSQKKF